MLFNSYFIALLPELAPFGALKNKNCLATTTHP